MSIGVPHVGHTAAWEYIEKDSILRIKQFRQANDGIVANYLHLQVANEEEARSLAEPIVAILNDKSRISGMSQALDGGQLYVYRPE
ncbi:MAG: hypothetical protein M3M96_06585 [Candidatus Eremiobacteraeota bacterium]|nr:hypothetical protein [Candidatus Eremiobacteraeota bacterium]